MRKLIIIPVLIFFSGCTYLLTSEWDSRYGQSNPDRFDQPTPTADISYHSDIEPILNQRCVVCHACYDAPCQLKLQSYDGLTRGANTARIYGENRLLADDPTRLNMDAQTNAEWRKKGFFPVLNERDNNPEANIAGSVTARMLLQKQAHPLPDQQILPDSFRLGLNDKRECTRVESFDSYENEYPLWGMPYGLPGLSSEEHHQMIKWLEQGAPYEPAPPVPDELLAQVAKWEEYLNQDDNKSQLISRYIFEHLFPSHLYFGGAPNPIYFEMVRSRTPAPQKIDIIAARFPFIDPGVKRVYYRFRPVTETIVYKAHQPYLLDESRKAYWDKWLFKNDFTVTSLPGYDIEEASNPFLTFKQIPVESRYRFMLQEAEFTIMSFIKGPVCRGSLALNVINDHFWVMFVNPNYQSTQFDSEFLSSTANILALPASDDANAGVLNWMRYAKEERTYLEARAKFLNEVVETQIEVNLDMMWSGDGDNNNAALTIYRHFDSATVIKGLHGGKPQTAWVIDYTLLERIHYLLVSGFDVFGNVGHQLNTRIYMDFLRMEGEFNFMILLPKDYRMAVHKQWYRGNVNEMESNIYAYHNMYKGDSSIDFKTTEPLSELYDLVQERLSPILDHTYDLDQGFKDKNVITQLKRVDSVLGIAASHMPQVSVVKISDGAQIAYYTLLSNTAYSNISHLYGEEDRHLPNEDTLTVSYGVIAAYPNVFFDVPSNRLEDFTNKVTQLDSADAYQKLVNDYGVRRTAKNFWQFSDELQGWLKQNFPIDSGILDYNRLENL